MKTTPFTPKEEACYAQPLFWKMLFYFGRLKEVSRDTKDDLVVVKFVL